MNSGRAMPAAAAGGRRAALWGAVLALEAAAAGLLAYNALLGVVVAVGGLAAVLLLIDWRRAALVVAAVVPLEAYFIPVGGLRLKLYQVVASAAFVGLLADMARVRTGVRLPFVIPIVAFVALSALSISFSILPAETVRIVALQIILVVVYVVVTAACSREDHLQKAMLTLAVAGAVVAAFGMYQLFAYHLGLPTGITRGLGEGRPWSFLTRYGRPSGTFFEPDWLGAFAMQAALLAIPMAIHGSPRYRRVAYLSGTLSIAGLLVSGARAAWLGFAIGAASLLLFRSARRMRLLGFAAIAAFLVVGLLAVMAAVYPEYATLIHERLTNMFDTRSHGIAGRVNTLAVIVEQIRVHPLRGSGTGILDALVAGRQQTFAGRLGPNLFLTTWMETGVAGALLLLWLFGLTLWRVGRAARRSDTFGALAQGLFAGVIALVVQSQFNNSFLLGFFWVQLGLCAAAVVIHERGGGVL
jgi:O-antigen ligase